LEDLSLIPSISFYGTSDSIKISTSQDLCHYKFQELLDSGRESKMTRQEFHAFILDSRPWFFDYFGASFLGFFASLFLRCCPFAMIVSLCDDNYIIN
jgi:hypothetical protein